MGNTKTTRLLFKGSWILTYFWHSSWLYFGYISGKVAKPHLLESLYMSLKHVNIHINRAAHYEITSFQKYEKFVLFGGFFFKSKNCWHLEFLMNQIFGRRFIIFKKVSYRGQLLLKLRVIEVTVSFRWISSKST